MTTSVISILFGLRLEGGTIDAVAISEQEPGGLVPRKFLEDLGCRPLSCWMLGDIEMNNAPAIMSQNKKHVEDLEGHGANHEEVDGNQLVDVVFQEGPPGLGRPPDRTGQADQLSTQHKCTLNIKNI